MYKRRIPQGRGDVEAFQAQVGRELLRAKVLGEGNPRNRTECLLRYDQWKKHDESHVKNIKMAAAHILTMAAQRRPGPLRDIVDNFLLADRYGLHSSLRVLGSAYFTGLFMEVLRKEDTSALRAFLRFLEQYL